MKKQLLPMLLLVMLLGTMVVPAYAVDGGIINANMTNKPEIYNEYAQILEIRDATPDKLQKMGLTEQDVNAFEQNFKDSLLTRALQSEERLEALGYSSEEIAIFQKYAEGAELTSVELLAISGTCTGEISRHTFTDRTVSFSYSWTWDKCPLTTTTDAAATRWIGYDVNGYSIGLTRANRVARIYYYKGQTYDHSTYATFQEKLDANTESALIPVYKVGAGPADDMYAKSGSIMITASLESGVTNSIYYVQVAGIYGHNELGISTPSLSISAPMAVSISYTTIGVNNIAGRQAIINASGCRYV